MNCNIASLTPIATLPFAAQTNWNVAIFNPAFRSEGWQAQESQQRRREPNVLSSSPRGKKRVQFFLGTGIALELCKTMTVVLFIIKPNVFETDARRQVAVLNISTNEAKKVEIRQRIHEVER
jgi:hypothetical protein